MRLRLTSNFNRFGVGTLNISRERLLVIALFAATILSAAFLRFFMIGERPGFEWDEPVYASISQNFAERGVLAVRSEAGQTATEPYLYHPPFDVALRGGWAALSGSAEVQQLRLVSASAALLLLGLAFGLVRYLAGTPAAFVGLGLLATDGWLIYTNRLNLIENMLMPIGVGGLWLYAIALRRDRAGWYALAGVVLATAFVYKYIGVIFLLTPVVYLLLNRQKIRQHFILLGSAAGLVAVYLAAMWLIWSNQFVDQNLVQFLRAFGFIESRGLNFGIGVILQALLKTYWIFFVTVLSLAGCAGLLGWRSYRWLRKNERPPQPLLFSWAVAAFAIMLAASLKAPHYLIVLLVPVYIYLASEIAPVLLRLKPQWLKVGLVGLVIALNLLTWNLRFVVQDDNALLQTYRYAAANLPANAKVLTEESIGVGIRQPYYRFDRHSSAAALEQLQPDYIIVYYSTTQRPPDTLAFQELLAKSQELTRISGFKEDIRVYKVQK
jgi:4-amino-4-deoxy-L-arabinose transferase-like glycosyltransferase